MSVLNDIVYLRQDQYDVLAADGTVGSLTGLQDDKIYFVTDSTITANDLDQDLVIPVSHGGTGKTSFTAGSVLIGNGSSPLTELSATNINTANTIVKRDADGDFNAGKATLTSATIASINITTKKLEPVNQINSDSGNMILAYKPSSGTGVTSSQWCVGTIDIQGVIRSNNTDLIHTRAGTNSIILDTGNWISNIKYLPLYETRSTTTTLNKTANYVTSGAVFHLIASSSTSTTDNGKPPMGDANILQMNWDNSGGYDAQLAISTAENRMEFRDQPSTKKAWREVVTSTPGTAAGGTTQPVYIDTNGVATALSYTIEKSVPSNAVFTDHYAWGDITGKPTKITLTGAVTGNVSLGSGDLSLSTTVNHNHDDLYKIASGVITLGSNTITPITSIAELTGSTITAANLRTNLGLSAALRFIGKATTDMSESTTIAPTVTGVTNYIPEVGDVVLDKNSDAEYVCIAKSGSTYTWELLGQSGSWATNTHTHGNISNSGTIGQTSNWTLANGDGLVVFDSSNSNKLERTGITFDGSTKTKALTPAGTWETFLTSHQTYTAVSNKKPTANQTPGFGATFDIEQVSQDASGQVSVTERTVTIPATIATNAVVGLVKPWYSHSVASTGPTTGSNATAITVNAIQTTANRYYAIESDSNGRLFVNVPWTNVNSSYLTAHNNLVKQTLKSDNTKYNLLASAQAAPTSGTAYEAIYNTDVFINPSLSAVGAKAYMVNEKVTLQWNSTDSSLDFVFA